METQWNRVRRHGKLPAKSWWLLAVTLVGAAGLALHGPIAQWADYHHFADTRGLGGIPNLANVLSNLPFALVGAWALWTLRKGSQDGRLPGPAATAWRCFAASVFLTAFGSAWYHWAPDNSSLVFDRLPIAGACASLLCALLAERVDRRWGHPAVVTGALLFAGMSVMHWWWTELAGHSDLRLYAAMQFLPMLLVPAVLALRLAPTCEQAVRGRDWMAVLVLYAAAKLAESWDHALMDSLGVLSGHTFKHLLAAVAAGWLLRAVALARRA